MQQLYARVFCQILDSSIAEDFFLRHIFEDFLKVASREGIVDITRDVLARRFVVPIDKLNEAISRLMAPDPKSRPDPYEGRRLAYLDEGRDWGWKILNWEKYDSIRTKADVALRVAKHRERKQNGRVASNDPVKTEPRTKNPTLDEVKLVAAKAGLPVTEAEKFFNYYESNGWKVGRNPMKSMPGAIANWKKNIEERQYQQRSANAPSQETNWPTPEEQLRQSLG